jgi:hypothetical protein
MGNPSSAGMQLGASVPAQRTMGAGNVQKNAKKRGLFGAIFEWLKG